MHEPCKRLAKNAVFCVVVGAVIYESFLGEHHSHLAEHSFSYVPTTTTILTVGTASATTTTL